jgi:hypothetical protein
MCVCEYNSRLFSECLFGQKRCTCGHTLHKGVNERFRFNVYVVRMKSTGSVPAASDRIAMSRNNS